QITIPSTIANTRKMGSRLRLLRTVAAGLLFCSVISASSDDLSGIWPPSWSESFSCARHIFRRPRIAGDTPSSQNRSWNGGVLVPEDQSCVEKTTDNASRRLRRMRATEPLLLATAAARESTR